MQTSTELPTLARIFQDAGNILFEAADGWHTSHLPIHDSESKQSLHINSRGWWTCWSCQKGGGLVEAAASLYNLSSPQEAETWLTEHFPLNVQRLAESKGLPIELLTSFGVDNVKPGIVAIPYRDFNGAVVDVKTRSAYTARLGSNWPKGKKLLAYGLERLSQARELGWAVLVEGETDTWTLTHHRVPVIGAPGASQAGVLRASYLEGLQAVYIWKEPGAGGETFVRGIEKHLSALGFSGEVWVLHHEKAKDPTILHQWYGDDFIKEFEKVKKASIHLESGSVWKRAKSAPEFLAEPNTIFEGLAKDVLAPGAMTLMASPRGLGKTLMSEALGVALATGGVFRGEPVKPVRVLLVDRDNPEPVIKERLRGWGADVAHHLHILTRTDAPSLADRAAWAAFPVESYDVLIIDAVGSATEGITEKEGKETTEVLATLLDLTHRGLSVLLLQNVTKDGLVIRGRGEWMDRADIVYEIRDATGFVPSLKSEWWTELPDASEGAWAARAARRKGRSAFRLAFVVSKFRLGQWPEPFCLEFHVPKGEQWTVADVTEILTHEAEEAHADAIRAQQNALDAAAMVLLILVKKCEQEGDPLSKREAEEFLRREQELTQAAARELVRTQAGKLWNIIPAPSTGGRPGQVLISISGPRVPAQEEDIERPCSEYIHENTYNDHRKSKVLESLSPTGQEGALSVAPDISGSPEVSAGRPCIGGSAEGGTFRGERILSPNGHEINGSEYHLTGRWLFDFPDTLFGGLMTGRYPAAVWKVPPDAWTAVAGSGDVKSDTSPSPAEVVAIPSIEVKASFDPPNITYIQDSSHLERVLLDILAAKTLAIDTETTGLDPLVDRVRLLQIATPTQVYVIDVRACPVERLAPVLQGDRWLILQHAKFDVEMLVRAGLPWPSAHVFDTMLGAQVLSASKQYQAEGTYGLGTLVEHFLDIHLDKTLQTSAWDGELSPEQLRYAAVDAAILHPLAKRIQQYLKAAKLWKVATLEGACTVPLAWVELSGMPVDTEQWRAHATMQSRRKGELAAELSALAGKTINWNSWQQVLPIVNGRNIPVTSTGEDVLMPYVHDAVVAKLLEYREAAKYAQTYGEKWLKHVHPSTGRVHADFLQAGSAAGRMSCKQPNLQNIPRVTAYRRLFKAGDGRCIIKADYGQIELRIAAVIAPDEAMLQACHDGVDLHTLTAAGLLGLSPNDVTRDHRQLAKAVNFGLLYGMGREKLQETAWKDYGVRLSEVEAGQHRSHWLELYPGIRRWHHRVGNQVKDRRTVDTRTLYGRRRLGIDRYTDALNSPVQGSGADGLKLALVRLFQHRDEAPEARLVNVVHDEILAECPMDQADATAQWLQRHMEEAMQEIVQWKVPTPVEVHVGKSWAG